MSLLNVPIEQPDSHLDRHNFDTDVNKTPIQIAFHTYYNDSSLIYYELTPIVNMLKFVKEKDILNSVPRKWTHRAEDFKDIKFSNSHILPETLFGEYCAVSYIIASSDSKIRTEYLEKLSNLCIRKIENHRIQRIHQKNKKLTDEVAKLRNKHEEHSGFITAIRESVKLMSEHHNILEGILHKLYDKL